MNFKIYLTNNAASLQKKQHTAEAQQEVILALWNAFSIIKRQVIYSFFEKEGWASVKNVVYKYLE